MSAFGNRTISCQRLNVCIGTSLHFAIAFVQRLKHLKSTVALLCPESGYVAEFYGMLFHIIGLNYTLIYCN